jgi:uncharacterized membrane protein
MLKAALPVFLSVTVSDELVWSTGTLPNDKLVVERLALALAPAPVTATL